MDSYLQKWGAKLNGPSTDAVEEMGTPTYAGLAGTPTYSEWNATAQRPDTSSTLGSEFVPSTKGKGRKNDHAVDRRQRSFGGSNATKESFHSKDSKASRKQPKRGRTLVEYSQQAKERRQGEEEDDRDYF